MEVIPSPLTRWPWLQKNYKDRWTGTGHHSGPPLPSSEQCPMGRKGKCERQALVGGTSISSTPFHSSWLPEPPLRSCPPPPATGTGCRVPSKPSLAPGLQVLSQRQGKGGNAHSSHTSGWGCPERQRHAGNSEGGGKQAAGARTPWRSLHPQTPNSGPVCGLTGVGAQAGRVPLHKPWPAGKLQTWPC